MPGASEDGPVVWRESTEDALDSFRHSTRRIRGQTKRDETDCSGMAGNHATVRTCFAAGPPCDRLEGAQRCLGDSQRSDSGIGGYEALLTETTRCDIGCQHDWRAARLELSQYPVALLLCPREIIPG